MGLIIRALLRAIFTRLLSTVGSVTTVQWWLGTIVTIQAAVITGQWDIVVNKFAEWWNSDEVTAQVKAILDEKIAAYADFQLGLELDPTDPLTTVSLSNALGLKLGMTLNDITDREQTLTDVGVYLAAQVNTATGAHFDNFWPLDNVGDQIAREAMLGVQQSMNSEPSWVPAYQVNNLLAFVRQHDGVFVNRTEKTDRAALLNRQHQAKYALTHHRAYAAWVENV